MTNTNITISINGNEVTGSPEVIAILLSGMQNSNCNSFAFSDASSTTLAPTTPKARTSKPKKSKTFSPATDFEIPYELRKSTTDKGYILAFSARVPRDAYTVIAQTLESEGIKYIEKTGFPFKTKKSAEEFMTTHKVISASERETIRATWHKEA